VRASILRRLADLEAVAARRATPPIILIDVTKLPDGDRDAYWSGDGSVLARHGVPDHEALPAEYIATIVIDLTPSRRVAWKAGYGRDEPPEADDAHGGREGMDPALLARVRAEVAATRARAIAIAESETRAVWTHDEDGHPIYDDDPRLAYLFR